MDPTDLQPLNPKEGIELYKQDRARELSEATLRSHGYRLERFREWCVEEGFNNLNELTGRDLQRFKLYRQQQVSDVTLKSQMDTLRVFIRFCETIDAVIDGLSESINSPSLAAEDARGTDCISRDKAEAIIAYLDKYRYAQREHVVFRLLWETGMRMGALIAIDLHHYHSQSAYVELRHNPETGTPLKNKTQGERDVALSSRTCRLLDDYIDEHRNEIRDDHGRQPLLTTRQGRITRNTVRNYIYRLTRPCIFNGGDCPHDREIKACDGRDNQTPYHCPSATAPHSIRHGAITDYLTRETPGKIVSERMDVSMDVIEKVYDHRSEREKMALRRNQLDL